ncbi:MAG: hypothetical protein ACI4T8_02340 [Christensenellales bacterium]
MATRVNSQKESQRADIEFNTGHYKMTKRNKRKAKKTLKSIGPKGWLIAFCLLIVGIGLGIGAFYITSRNDHFNIVGAEELSLTLDEKYIDEGVSITAFGKDISDSVVIDTNLKVDANGCYYSDEVGTFYIRYSSTNIKYGSVCKVQKVRLITFVEPSEGEEKIV